MKKILCLLLVFMIVFSTVAFALPQRPEMGNCSDCGGAMSLIDTSYGSWISTGKTLGDLTLCYRAVTEIYECTSCGNIESLSFTEYDYLSELPID